MEEKVKQELEKFQNLYDGLNENLSIGMLTDVIGYMTEIKEEEGKEILDFTKLDETIKNIKELLGSIPIDSIREIKNIDILKNNLELDLEQDERLRQECFYSMRTINWLINDVIEEEKKDV